MRSMRIQEFAKETGVTVRTLHHYDRLGLLRPQRLASGYRIYGEREFLRLQRIVVLKFIGCSLQEIRELIDRTPDDLRTTLDLQEEALMRRRTALDGALRAVERARAALRDQGSVDWQSLKHIVETTEMEQNTEWMKKYYSPEAQSELASRGTEAAEQGQRDWAALLADCEQAVKEHLDPCGERGQQLAKRWVELLNAFTQGSAEVKQGLNKFYADQANWTASFKRPWSDEVDRFINEAKRAASLNCNP